MSPIRKQVGMKLGHDFRQPDIFSIGGEAGISPEAQAVIDKMPTTPEVAEQNKINVAVNAAVSAGQWDDLDFVFVFGMADEDNGLTSWIKTKTATNVNSATHTEAQGFAFNGSTNYINLNVNLTSELTQASLNNHEVSVYSFADPTPGLQAYMFGGRDGANNGIELAKQNNPSRALFRESQAANLISLATGDLFTPGSWFGLKRDASNNLDVLRDENSVYNASTASVALPTQMWVGTRSPGFSFWDGTAGAVIIGAARADNYEEFKAAIKAQFFT